MLDCGGVCTTAKTQECTVLEKKLKAAQTAIAALFHDNEAPC
ncbi:hypothetical protein [Streptomyces sp. 150FB]|nr:hypothetical protein [Streptomyces sp. 150FB]